MKEYKEKEIVIMIPIYEDTRNLLRHDSKKKAKECVLSLTLISLIILIKIAKFDKYQLCAGNMKITFHRLLILNMKLIS